MAAGRGYHCNTGCGNFLNALMGDVVRGLVGLIIAGALLVYLLSARVEAAFSSGAQRLR
jgi:hypothetical protein